MGHILKWFDLLIGADEDAMHSIAESKAFDKDQTLVIIGVE
jgi:hypothetical protein